MIAADVEELDAELFPDGRLPRWVGIRRDLRHRERHCRMCAKQIDFKNDAGVRRDVRQVRYRGIGVLSEMFAYCSYECRAAYERWEETQ